MCEQTWVDCIPAMKQRDMCKSSSKPGKARSNGEGKQGAKIELPVVIISSNIELKIGSQNLGSIIFLACSGEELIRENGEFAGIKGVELPVANREDDINEHNKPNTHV